MADVSRRKGMASAVVGHRKRGDWDHAVGVGGRGGVPIIDRSSVNAFDDPEVARAITETGRTKLIFAGISLEVCAAFPAITAVGMGLDAYVAVDASGTLARPNDKSVFCACCRPA
ncbi:MAG: isochorismatase family protein [Acetobacteraceae bacterium]|nr:isochorismatase family protein [Acetobacteraceae bacterium]MBV8521145.1 isochorismatase family protein [Acetobacteraceae bacterium]